MTPIAIDARTAFVDVLHEGRRSLIGVGVLECDNGVALMDPGPEARLETLWAGLAEIGCAPADVRAVLLTHIHLDHAAATGAIVRAAPDARVFVHPAGARHMTDPTRLLASASRLYGDRMKPLWGDFLPVPPSAVREVNEGSTVEIGGRRLEVAYVPGHAKSHVAYFEPETGVAWVGDVAGIRIEGGPTIPPTPPTDVDVEAWNRSIDRVMTWRPERIAITHFGVHDDPGAAFERLRETLSDWAARVAASLRAPRLSRTADGLHGPFVPAEDAPDRQRASAFAERVGDELSAAANPKVAELYAVISGFEDSWRGLARYWRTLAAARQGRGEVGVR